MMLMKDRLIRMFLENKAINNTYFGDFKLQNNNTYV